MYDELLKHKWHTNKGYLYTFRGKKSYAAHWLVVGKHRKPLVTDHLDQDKTNNRRSNLLHVKQYINARNCRRYNPESVYRHFPFDNEEDKEMFHKYYVRGERDIG